LIAGLSLQGLTVDFCSFKNCRSFYPRTYRGYGNAWLQLRTTFSC